MDINVEDLIAEAGRTIFKRGVHYLQQGRVNLPPSRRLEAFGRVFYIVLENLCSG